MPLKWDRPECFQQNLAESYPSGTLVFMAKVSIADILELSIPERIQLAQEIWDSIGEMPEGLELTTAQKEELERRMAVYRGNPDAAIPWEEVKKRIGL